MALRSRQRLERNEHVAGVDLRIRRRRCQRRYSRRRSAPPDPAARWPSSAAAFGSSAGTRCFDRPAASRPCVRCPAAGKKPLGTKMYSSTLRQIVAMKISSTSPLMLKRPGQRTRVEVAYVHKKAAVRASASRSRRPRPQEQTAHHRRGRERDRQRYQDRDRKRDGEFAEQPSEDAAHQQNREEHRDQREADRQHGEADLARAAKGGLHRRQSVFHVTGDVFQNDDGVIDDEAGGDGQRHQRQQVEAVAEQVHHAEGADDRDRHRNAGNERWRGRCGERDRRPA